MNEHLKQRPGDQPLPARNRHPDIQTAVIADIAARRDIGIQRYSTALQPFNHRDGLRDAYEEAMDLTVYLRQVLEERNLTPAVLRLLAAEAQVHEERRDHDALSHRLDVLHEVADQVRAAIGDREGADR